MFDGEGLEILVYSKSVDMRRAIDGLSILISERLSLNPSSGTLYVFFNRSRDKIKILFWQRNGFVLWYKRLEKERFKLSFKGEGILTLTFQQLRWLLDGLDLTKIQGHKSFSYASFY